MKRFSLIFSIVIFTSVTYAQKVGVVLSGGAAKGLAHVGVLKALEENEIPVDYIVGTSMGGIIGGCYAVGMSPEQIENLVLSEDFLHWVNGQNEKGFNYYYHQSDENPHFLKVNLSLDSIFNFQLNTSLANDVSLNFAMAEKTATGSAIAHNNFDSLFVPLRVVAADIFTQSQVILAKGSLGDALRATQTVPFFYNPIRVDGKYLFDGGVYNNFPVDVAQEVFNPDVIIGANVSTKVYNEYPFDTDEKLISKSLLFLLLDKSDPTSVPTNGVYIQPDLEGFSSFDFAKVKSLIDSGYNQTMRQMDEIKSKVARRVECETVNEQRNKFNNKSPALKFTNLDLRGFNSKQRKYIQKLFRFKPSKPKPFYLSRVKSGYFNMVAQDYFTNVYPNILYDSLQRTFSLQLTRRPQKNFQVDFGGVIASRDVSNIFLGVNLFNFNSQLIHFYGGFQTGNFYKSAILRTRIDFPRSFYVEPELSYDNWDYLEGDDLLTEIASHTVLRRIDRSYSMTVGMPVGNFFKTTITGGGINNIDRFANGNVFVSTDTLDHLRVRGFKGEWNFSANTLNRKQYPSTGKAFGFSLQYFNVNERYSPGNTSYQEDVVIKNHQWFRAKATAEQYFNTGWYKVGYLAEVVFSNQPTFQNFYSTIINAPAFYPLQDSRSLLLENFRAFNYFAGGVRNVFQIRNRLDFRLEGYFFKAVESLKQNSDQDTEEITSFTPGHFAATAGLVLHAPMGPISLSVNYYDDEDNQLGVLLHVGFLLFNKHSME